MTPCEDNYGDEWNRWRLFNRRLVCEHRSAALASRSFLGSFAAYAAGCYERSRCTRGRKRQLGAGQK